MKPMEKKAFIIGNGASRKDYDLMNLKGKGTVFGCNALYRNYRPNYELPDYLVAIDDAIITEIESSDFPSKRFIVPPQDEQWEPVELHWGRATNKQWNPARPRSNAGMNSILEAIKMGHSDLFIFGFDFLVVDQNIAMSNLYDGTNCYGLETRANLQDTRNRMNYLGWVIEKYIDVSFFFCYDKSVIDSGVYRPDAKNCNIIAFDMLENILNTGEKNV